MFVVYVIAQVLGAFIGFGFLVLITPEHIFRPNTDASAGHCSTVPVLGLGEGETFAIEFFATLVLISMCCSSWDPRNAGNQDSVAIKFGLTVGGLSLAFVSHFLPQCIENFQIYHIYFSIGQRNRMQHEPGPNAGSGNLEQRLDDALGVLVGSTVLGSCHNACLSSHFCRPKTDSKTNYGHKYSIMKPPIIYFKFKLIRMQVNM